jgi:hypothetical protein
MNRMLSVFVVLVAVACSACDKEYPGRPSLVELAPIPSNQAPVMSIKVEREGTGTGPATLMRVTLGENFNQGLSADRGLNDWNGAKVRIVWRCNGAEEFRLMDMNSGNTDPQTRKNNLVFVGIPTCNGVADFRLRYSPVGNSALTEFDFPDPSNRLILLPAPAMKLVRDSSNGFSYVTGTVQ